jgi:hypothetical protein
MLNGKDNLIQSKLSAYVQSERPYTLSSIDPILMVLVDYDISESERQLRIFEERYPNDCMVEGKNPLRLRVYPTFFSSPSDKFQHENFVKRRRRK